MICKTIKIVAVAFDKEWEYSVDLTDLGRYYLLEIGVGVFLPMEWKGEK
ncbi:MAG: hypothetical protein GQ559_09935 [Desulfobulbaceae bacterium]|nr:hypothetical protein [Desulfobulbaceae bacterium]